MTSLALFAQAATVAHWAVVLILICGVIGVLFVVVRATGVAIPPFVITIFWIVLACVIGVAAIHFLMAYL